MKKAIQKAAVLIEALPYIQRFRDEIIVVKVGGSAMENEAQTEGILKDVAFMACVGMRPVIVHGGGNAISRVMKERGIESRFVKGLRVTCERSIEVVSEVIGGDVNPKIVEALRATGTRAEGVDGRRVLTVTHKTEIDETTGELLDWGFVGEPDEVREEPIRVLIRAGIVPVITPLGTGRDGKSYNINADVAAAAVARALKARKLAFLSDVPGLLRDPQDPESLIGTLKVDEVEFLIEKGVIQGGMLPKVQSGVEAIRSGVRKVHMIDGRMPHSLLLEIFTDKGVGTEIVAEA